MRVLVACEFSGVVRDAFSARGHDAWSCDILPAKGNHIRADVLTILDQGWDLMIAHPPCTYLCNSGVCWLFLKDRTGRRTRRSVERFALMEHAREFFLALLNAEQIPLRAVENPIPHSHADLPEYDQTIQPWQFGHGETKATCLWLRGLPPLEPTEIVDGREPRVHKEAPGASRWKKRSVTYAGIARAMADQWEAHNETMTGVEQ